jgi:hypothetical protein
MNSKLSYIHYSMTSNQGFFRRWKLVGAALYVLMMLILVQSSKVWRGMSPLCFVLCYHTSAVVIYREIYSATKTSLPLTSTVMRSTCLVMNFLTLCCNASPSLCSEVSVLALLSTVARYASRLESSCLSCHFLTAFSSLGSRPHAASNKYMTAGLDKISWELALSCPRSDTLVACKSTHSSKSLDL